LRLNAFSPAIDVPVLTALDDVPAGVHGHTVVGSVDYLPAFAPGYESTSRLSLADAPGDHVGVVRVLQGQRAIASAPVTSPSKGDSTYRIAGVTGCSRSRTGALYDGPKR